MIFHQHTRTGIGEIWIVDALENGFFKLESESRQAFEARVLSEIIQSMLGEVQLRHTSKGAPFIENHPELAISISHSENWFAIYTSDNPMIGVDIEIPSRRFKKIQDHFLSQHEQEVLDLSNDKLPIYWGVKESIIKRAKGEVEAFKEDIQIESISEKTVTARFKSKIIQLEYAVHRQFALVYTI